MVALSRGGLDLVEAHLNLIKNKYLVRHEGDIMETRVVFWRFDNAQHVRVDKWWTQAEKATKIGQSKSILDVESKEPLAYTAGCQAVLGLAGNREREAQMIRDINLKRHGVEDHSLPTQMCCGVPDGVITRAASRDSVPNLDVSLATSTFATAAASCAVGDLRNKEGVDSGTGHVGG